MMTTTTTTTRRRRRRRRQQGKQPDSWILVVLFLVVGSCCPGIVSGVIPNVRMTVAQRDGSNRHTLDATLADSFGASDFSSLSFPLVLQAPPWSMKEDFYLCPTVENGTIVYGGETPPAALEENIALWVPRGRCSFQAKAWVAQNIWGAAAIVIYNTLTSRYSLSAGNETLTGMQQILRFPQPRQDFECDLGEAWIDQDVVTVNASTLWADSGGVEWNQECIVSKRDDCESQRCLLTGRSVENEDKDVGWQSCCAWDMPRMMAQDGRFAPGNLTIPALFVTLRDAAEVETRQEIVHLEKKKSPTLNISSILLWVLGTFVTWVASYLSANEYRGLRHKLQTQTASRMETTVPQPVLQQQQEMDVPPTPPIAQEEFVVSHCNHDLEDNVTENEDGQSHAEMLTSGDIRRMATTPAPLVAAQAETNNVDSPAIVERRVQTTTRREGHRTITTTTTTIVREEADEGPVTLELNAYHALGFLVIGSATLLLLYFFEIYNVVRVLYALGCANATAQVILYPLLAWLFQRCFCLSWWKRPFCSSPNVGSRGNADVLEWCGCRDVSRLQWISLVAAFSLAVLWLLVGFWNRPNPSERSAFYWILQNVFGAAICIAFLGVIRLNSIRVGTLLLLAAFVYDIFFVFMTPWIFGDKDGDGEGDSVMVTVATSGGAPSDPELCEKYPHEDDCQRGTPLPMLFTLPRINDYRGGHVLLGLGDIVLPGLLLSFAARYDAARRLVAFHRPVPSSSLPPQDDPPSPHSHYLSWLTAAYAVGLMAALVAIILMNGRGQPALLYLVPSCLGTLLVLSCVEQNGGELWRGPTVMKEAALVVEQSLSRRPRPAAAAAAAPSTNVMHEEEEEGRNEAAAGASDRGNATSLSVT